MINTWWLICNSKDMSHPNPLGNAVRVGDGKTDFLEEMKTVVIHECNLYAFMSVCMHVREFVCMCVA